MIHKEPAQALIDLLNQTDETESLEAKSQAADEVGRSLLETICAMSNEPDLGGGTILLGVSRKDALFPLYFVEGVTNPDVLSSQISSQCATSFNHSVRVDILPEKVGKHIVLKVSVPELPDASKPLYFKATGLPRGAYRRVGPTDVRCAEVDLLTFYQGKGGDTYDARVIKDAYREDLDPAAITAYRQARRDANPGAEELNWSDDDLLLALGALRRVDGSLKVTATGMLVFGHAVALRRLFPAQRVDYVRVPGTTWVQDATDRFDTIDMRGPLLTLVNRVIAAILDDLPKTVRFSEQGNGQREDIPVLPLRVIREAVVNALMHRSYQTFTPVQVVRYANRLVIRNAGYSLKSQDRLEEPGSVMRNPHIAEILHETRFAETKGSGIRVMQQAMGRTGLAAPTFESDRESDEFNVTFLFHHFLGEQDWEWLSRFKGLELSNDQMRALIFVREVGAIDNSAYRSLTSTDTLIASRSLRGLRQLELLRDKGSGVRTYYVAGPEMERRAGESATIHDSATSMDGNMDGPGPAMNELPTALRTRVLHSQLAKRSDPLKTKELIEALIDWRPLALSEIARLLDRTPAYVSQKFISEMVSEGSAAYLFPEMIQHPGQKYLSRRLSEKQKRSGR